MNAIEIKDLLQYRFLSAVTAAPQGERAAFVVKQAREEENDYAGDIWLWERAAVRRLTAGGKSGSPVWEDDTHILFPAMREEKDRERAKNGERFSVWYRLDIRGGEAVRAFELPVQAESLTQLTGTLWFFVAPIDREHPDEYRMDKDEKAALAKTRKENADYHVLTDAAYRFNGTGFVEGLSSALFLWDSASGETTRLTGPDLDVSFAEAADGTILYGACAYQKTANFSTQLYRYDPASGKTETLYGGSDYMLGTVWSFGGSVVALATDFANYGRNQNMAFYTVSGGALRPLLDADLSLGNSVSGDCRLGGGHSFRIHQNALYFLCTVGGSTQLRCLNAKGNLTVVNRKEGSLDCFDITERGTILGVGLYDMALQELYEIGRGQKVTRLTSFNAAALEGRYVAQPLPLSVRSHGKRIDGWVLLPRDYDASKRYPAVLDIHGGPKTVYGPVFFHEIQVWAGCGYFVFFCNPTGSDGRGNAFSDIRGKYGTVDYDDLMAFTDGVLAAYPQIDVGRVAVTGGSYGGFMTNWIIGHTDRFACAATQRSISNWLSFSGVSDIGPYFSKDQCAADLYSPQGQKKLWFHSPLQYAANAVTPTLFIHSEEDYRCPIDQGLQLYSALLEKGVETRLVWFKGENHELSRSGKPKHRIRRLEEITQWFESYTAGGQAGA